MKKGILISSFAFVGFIGLGFISEYICKKYCPYSNGTQEYNSIFTIFCSFVSFIGSHIEIISVALTAAATGVMAYFTGRLQDSTDKMWTATKLAIESNERIERAYVFIERFYVRKRPDPGEEINNWFVSFKCKNVGRTPARIEKFEIVIIDIDKLPAIPDYTKGLFPLSVPFVLAANRSFKTTEVGVGIRSKDGEAIRYVVYGRITYKDLTGRECHTGFGIEISPHFPAGGTISNEAYTYYD